MDFTDYINDRTRNFTGREWVFENISNWLSDPNGSRYFLLTGEPGSGKTAIAARLTQFTTGEEKNQRFAQGFLRAVHFCSARDSISVDPKNFVEAIALQLAQIPAYANFLKEIDTKQVNIQITQNVGVVTNSTVQGVVINNLDVSGIMSAQEAFNLTVLNPLEALYKQGFSEPIVILVDSLDEALTHVGETKIVDLLSKIPQSLKARFILTSRKETQIESEFIGIKELFLSATEFEDINQDDIKTYVKKRLQDQTLSPQLNVNLDWKEQKATEISKLSEGNFLYVRFLLDAIADDQQSITELGNLPKGLDALYFDSLRRVVKLGKKDWGNIYAPYLGVLSVAQEGLTVSQLQAFTHQSESVTLECLNDLRQFVDEIKPESGKSSIQKYKFYHQSVIDFLGRRLITIDDKEQNNLYYTPEQEQHQRILQSYRPVDKAWKDVNLAKFDEYGLRHLTQHLVKAGRIEELHDLLALETTAERHAWFEAKDQIGDIEGFLADIALAWNKAEEEFQDNPGRAIGLQCRYALITTSVSKLASNISNSLLIALVKNRVWTEHKALSYVKQIPDSAQQFYALISLVPHLVDESLQQEGWRETLNAASSIQAPEYQKKALKKLFPSLPESLKQDALKIVLQITDTFHALSALWELFPNLSEPLKQDALKVVLKMKILENNLNSIDEQYYRTLSFIMSHLSETLAAEAFTALIDTHYWRILADASHLPELQWLTLWQKFLEIKYMRKQENLKEETWCERALSSEKLFELGLHQVVKNKIWQQAHIAAHLPYSALSEALKIVLKVSDENQVIGLTALAPHFSLSLKQDALIVALNIQDGELRMWALRFLVVYLGESEQQQVWQEILKVAPTLKLSASNKLRFFIDLARHIPESWQRQVWQEALSVFTNPSNSDRWRQSVEIIPYVPNVWKREVLNGVSSISNRYSRKNGLLDLVPFLLNPLRQEALDTALAIPAQQVLADKIQRNAGTIELPGFLKQAGKKAFDVGTATFSSFSEYETLESLCNLADYLPESLKQKVLSDVLKINKKDKQSKLLQQLLPHLNEAQKQQVLQSALKYRNEHEQSGLFQNLLPHLNEAQKQQILQSALKYRNEHERMWLLYVILPHISESQKQQILSEVLKLALKLTDEKDCVSLLRKLIPTLSESANQQILNAAFSIKDGANRLNLLYPLLSYIPESSKLKLLKAIEEIQEEKWRAEGLQDLMPRFSQELQQEALRIAGNIKDKQVRSQVLEEIASSLPEPLKQQTLTAALNAGLAIKDGVQRGIVTHTLTNSLPSSVVQNTLNTAISAVLFFQDRERKRSDFLRELQSFMPKAMQQEDLQQALASKTDSEVADLILNPVRHLPESIRLAALKEYIDNIRKRNNTQGEDIFVLESIAPKFIYLPSNELYLLWCYALKSIANSPRPTFLLSLHPFVKTISILGGKEALKATILAVKDVGRWWP
jgi:hypothetical protein